MTSYSYPDSEQNKILDLLKGFKTVIAPKGEDGKHDGYLGIAPDQIGMLVYWVKRVDQKLVSGEASQRSMADTINKLSKALHAENPKNKVLLKYFPNPEIFEDEEDDD